MQKYIVMLALVALLLVLGACHDKGFDFNQTYSTIQGTVTDWKTQSPLVGVKVAIAGIDSVYTNSAGQYMFEGLFPATYNVNFEFDGYYNETMSVLAKGSRTITANNIFVPLGSELMKPAVEQVEVPFTSYSYTFGIERMAPVKIDWELVSIPNWLVVDEDNYATAGTLAAIESNQADTLTIGFTVDRMNLRPGWSTGRVVYTANDILDTLVVRVQSKEEPVIYVDNAELDFDQFLPTQTFSIRNLGNGQDPLYWGIGQGVLPNWLSLNPESGRVNAGAEQEVTLTANRDSLAYGSFSYSFEIQSTNAANDNPTIGVSLQHVELTSLSVREVQYTEEAGDDGYYASPYIDQTIMVTGVVAGTNFSGSNYFVITPDGGEFSGLYVYDNANAPVIGDQVQLVGLITEYYGLTELKNITNYTIVNSNNSIGEPAVITTGQLASEEAWETSYIRVENVVVTSAPDSYGQWYVDDGSGACQVEDGFFKLTDYEIQISEGMHLDSITGLGYFSYDEYEIHPRTPDDLVFSEE